MMAPADLLGEMLFLHAGDNVSAIVNPAPVGATFFFKPGDNVSAIVNAAPVGATFFFEPGIYRGVVILPKTGQTFIGKEGAILNGSAVLTNFTRQGNLWVIGGQTQEGVRNATDAGDGVSMRPGYPETVFINDTPLKPVDALSKVVPGTFYFDYAADKIYIADDPAGKKVEAGKLAHAFAGHAGNVTVRNLVIEKYDPPAQTGAVQGNKGWIVQDNEVRLNYAVGIKGGENSKFIGNFVHDNGQMGLGSSGAARNNILVEGNEIAKNGFWSGLDVLWEGGGFKFARTHGLIVRGNYSHDNNGIGMWTDIDNIHTLYENNVVAHNTGGGISHEISYDAVIRNNTLIGNGYGRTEGWLWGGEIQIQNSQNVDVYGNRIDMTGGGNGVVLIQQNRGSGTYGPWVTTGNHIHDNVIVDHDSTGNIGGGGDYNWAGIASGGNTWTNNQYYMPDVGKRFWWDGTYNFAGFKNATHETGSISQSYPDTSSSATIPGMHGSDP
jgi:parallel beta-helix repeat protein